MLKKLFLSTLLISSMIAISGCQSIKSKKNGPAYASDDDMEVINGTFAQSLEDGTTFSDQQKCQATYNEPGIEQHIFFAFDQSSLSDNYLAHLKTQANYLNNHPQAKVKIEGNTDDRGSREYNVTLGWSRAKTVANVLQQYGVRKSQIITTSFGAERPAAFGQTETAWRCNRRVDLIFK